jgi:hypothetical protein
MKKLFVVLVVFLMLIFWNATVSQAQGITLGFFPDFQGVVVGNQVDVDVVISGLGNGVAPSLGVFNLYIGFDPTILAFDSVTFGDPVLGDQLDLWILGSDTATTPGVGTVNLYELSFDSVDDLNDYQADIFTLATLTFDTLSLGTSSLDITINSEGLGDAYGNPLTADLYSGSINVVPIPEPATLLLLCTGLAGIGFLTRLPRFKNNCNIFNLL